MKKLTQLALSTTLLTATFFGTTFVANDQQAEASSVYKNCKSFNAKYTHGVRKSAKTKNKIIKSSGKVVYETSKAKVSASLYKKAIQNNKQLDRDKDGIACEK
ncbi:hypothetical protein QI30_05645 [Kurthia sp. 3B1D]|uniref:Excalibur calcium-binding domain-containing protein n=1 Tax=Candidatus Kurthia intestinigallinarum TaxID=1562256 RepID=A0A433RW27_9BACL|nr:excalibur calcium-binding domain-containing protein [Kurthia sp. 3B1D]RUS57480.1 hypothetical protein QI30_05645 [Kurthia sp. 3B1D]